MASLGPLLDDWPQVTQFFLLRLAVAPCVETLILLDRGLFLEEAKGKNSVFLVLPIVTHACMQIQTSKAGLLVMWFRLMDCLSVLFLHAGANPTSLVPIFDAKLSPRNLAIIAHTVLKNK